MKPEILAVAALAVSIASGAQAEPTRGYPEYFRYCAACHGETGDGKGPVANVMHPPPPALTQLNAKYGRPLGTDLVTYVMGKTMPRAHGTSEMPVWGRNLAEPDGSDEKAIQTIWRIVHYLDSIQSN